MLMRCALEDFNSHQQYRKLMFLNNQYDVGMDHVDADVDNADEYVDHVGNGDDKEKERRLITFYLSILIILGISMNGYAIFKTKKAKRTPVNLSIRYLVMIEFLRSILALPNDISKNLWGADIKNYFFGGSFLFPSGTFLNASLGLSSFYIFVVLSILRHKCVVENETTWTSLTREPLLSKRHLMVGGIALLIASPPGLGIGHYDDAGVFCTPDWDAKDTYCILYNWFLMSFGFLLPSVIWLVNDYETLKTMQKVKFRRRRIVTKEILVMLASFYFVWIAYALVALFILFGYAVPQTTQLASLLVTKFGVFIYPYVFVFRNREIMKPTHSALAEWRRVRPRIQRKPTSI